jgi:hypothetical protein
MSDKDVSKEVVRFIVYFDRGINFPPTHLILGHGYGEIGRDHRTLNMIYGKQIDTQKGQHIYAGYFEVVGNRVHVRQGGSGTLSIPPDDTLDRVVRRITRQIAFLENFIITQFPLIVSNQVPHVMFAI